MKEYIINMIIKDPQNVRYYLEQLECNVDDLLRNEIFCKIIIYVKKNDYENVKMLIEDLNIEEDEV